MAYKVLFYLFCEVPSMKELGEYFKTTRIKNGVSLEEAAEDLELSTSKLENIESGNERAFEDIYKLKEYVRSYAKYLGLNPTEVADEFNDFLFEKTSKISLDDIKEARKRQEAQQEKKIKSPYTKVYKEKFNFFPLIIALIVIIFVSLIIYIIVINMDSEPIRDTELKSIGVIKEDVV